MKKEVTIKKNLVFDGKILKVYRDDVLSIQGNKTFREYIAHRGGVCCLAYHDGYIYFERQYRYPFDKEIFELPAGKLEEGEKPIEAMHRELEEELGLKSNKMEEVSFFYPSCGYSGEIIYLFKSYDNVVSKQHLDDDEDFEIVKLTIDETYKLVDENKIHDGKTLLLLLLLKEELYGLKG